MLHRIAAILFTLIMIVMTAVPAFGVWLMPSLSSSTGLNQMEHIAVSTQGSTGVTETAATLSGYLESLLPYKTVEVWFDLSNGQSTPRRTMSAPGPFSARISGLTPGTSYEYCARAASTLIGGQTAQGDFMTFNTIYAMPKAPIQVATVPVAEVTSGMAVLQGHLSSMGPYDAVTVWFNWGNTPNLTNNSSQQVVYGPGPFSIPVSGLQPNTTYYFRAAALPQVIGVATVYGSTSTFHTPGGNMAVSTGAESSVTGTSATIIGYLDSLGAYRNAYVWFEWGPTAAYGQTTAMQTMYNTGQFSVNLQNLNPGTTYHFRALAAPGAAGGVTVRGLDSIFTTAYAPRASLNTSSASNISASSASLNGLLASPGSSSPVDVWFEWGPNATLGQSTPRQPLNIPGNFTFELNGLVQGTTYYYRAAAYTNGTVTYGSTVSFRTTSSSPASVLTNSASSISTTGATLNAYVNSLGTLKSVDVYFQWGITSDYGNTTQPQVISYPGAISFELNGLAPGTDYYFQAFTQAADGSRVYGGQSVFTTISNVRAAVAALPATDISSATAVLNGELKQTGGASSMQVWFEYGTSAQFGNSTTPFTMKSPGNFSTPLSGLAPGRAYYYRAVALNQAAGSQSVHSPISTFSTAGGPAPSPQPDAGVPIFVWFIGSGMMLMIIILIILLGTRK